MRGRAAVYVPTCVQKLQRAPQLHGRRHQRWACALLGLLLLLSEGLLRLQGASPVGQLLQAGGRSSGVQPAQALSEGSAQMMAPASAALYRRQKIYCTFPLDVCCKQAHL